MVVSFFFGCMCFRRANTSYEYCCCLVSSPPLLLLRVGIVLACFEVGRGRGSTVDSERHASQCGFHLDSDPAQTQT